MFPPDCGVHGTVNVQCGCDCASGWGTAPGQDLAHMVYCSVSSDLVDQERDSTQGTSSPPSPGSESDAFASPASVNRCSDGTGV